MGVRRLSEHPLLRIRELRVSYQILDGATVEALRGVNLTVERGKILGVLGESGSGKSTLLHAVLGLLPASGAMTAGEIFLDGRGVPGRSESAWQQLRGSAMSIIFQDPSLRLSPYLRIGSQIADVLVSHRKVLRRECRQAVEEMLAEVGFSAPSRITDAYPHQLSGGESQRVSIAQALICHPRLLLADEPTSALDTVTQKEILTLLQSLRCRLDMAIVFVTHDPDLLPDFADTIAVFKAGVIAECGSTRDVLQSPKHPYTQMLLGLRAARRTQVSGSDPSGQSFSSSGLSHEPF